MKLKLNDLLEKNELTVYEAKELLTQVSDMLEYNRISYIPEQLKKDIQDCMDAAKTIGSQLEAVYERAGDEFSKSEQAFESMRTKMIAEKKRVDKLCESLEESNDRLERESNRAVSLIDKFRYISDSDIDHLINISARMSGKKFEEKQS